MEIAMEQSGAVSIVSIAGRMDAVSAPELEKFMSTQDLAGSFVFDVSGLEYVSSAGLRTLLMVGKQIKGASGRLVLAGLNGIVKDVFDLSGFQKLFIIKSTPDKAVDFLT